MHQNLLASTAGTALFFPGREYGSFSNAPDCKCNIVHPEDSLVVCVFYAFIRARDRRCELLAGGMLRRSKMGRGGEAAEPEAEAAAES